MKHKFNLVACYLLCATVSSFGLISCDGNKGKEKESECVKQEVANSEVPPSYLIEESVEDSIALPVHSNFANATLNDALVNRRTVRSFSDKLLSDQQISDLLWTACGVNREDGKLTTPTARNCQEIDVYLFTPKAIYFYQKSSHSLKLFKTGDFREKAGNQAFYRTAPIAISLVGDFKKMDGFDDEAKQFYTATDAGYVSQDVYLYCSATGLATVACGNIDRALLSELLEIKDGKALLSHPVGYELIEQ